jgi:hypothetical protein
MMLTVLTQNPANQPAAQSEVPASRKTRAHEAVITRRGEIVARLVPPCGGN